MKIYFLVLVFFVLQLSLSGQSCLPEGIDFNAQSQIDNFATNHPNCTEIEGDVEINGTDIINLAGLSLITKVWGHLVIDDCPRLKNLSGLDQLSAIGGSFIISDNDSLTELSGLEQLTTIEYFFLVEDNEALLSVSQLSTLTSIGLDLIFTENEFLPEISGFDKLESIGGVFDIYNNWLLTDISGFNNLTTIGSRLWIETNYHLLDISGFNKLESIAGYLMISDQPDLIEISGFGNLSSIGQELRLVLNYELPNLGFLNTLESIGTKIIIDANYSLTSIEGLRNVDTQSIINLTIISNHNLAECHIESICSFLANPGGSVFIENNSTGCNSKDEVIEACETISVHENNVTSETKLHFDLESNKLVIISAQEFFDCNIYSGIGQKIFSTTLPSKVIDVSGLPRGLYVVELLTERLAVKRKIMLQ